MSSGLGFSQWYEGVEGWLEEKLWEGWGFGLVCTRWESRDERRIECFEGDFLCVETGISFSLSSSMYLCSQHSCSDLFTDEFTT